MQAISHRAKELTWILLKNKRAIITADCLLGLLIIRLPFPRRYEIQAVFFSRDAPAEKKHLGYKWYSGPKKTFGIQVVFVFFRDKGVQFYSRFFSFGYKSFGHHIPWRQEIQVVFVRFAGKKTSEIQVGQIKIRRISPKNPLLNICSRKKCSYTTTPFGNNISGVHFPDQGHPFEKNRLLPSSSRKRVRVATFQTLQMWTILLENLAGQISPRFDPVCGRHLRLRLSAPHAGLVSKCG